MKMKQCWELIAKKASEDNVLFNFDQAACAKKQHNLMRTWREKKDGKNKTGRGGGKLWLYYELLDEITGKSASVLSLKVLTQ